MNRIDTTGIGFYEHLRAHFNHDGQELYGNFTFHDWRYKAQNGTYSFRFNIPSNSPKAIPRDIIVAAWEAGQDIDDEWIEENFDMRFHDDCRLRVLRHLLERFRNLD